MSFSKYLSETTRLIEAPVTGDRIDIDINELFCIETEIVEHGDDSYVIHVDEDAYAILQSLDLLEDEVEVEETSGYDKKDGSPYDRGDADAYYGRRANPHKYVDLPNGNRERVELTDPKEIDAYMAGYQSGDSGQKDWGESKQVQPTTNVNESLNLIRKLSGLNEAITITHTEPRIEAAKPTPIEENDDVEIWDRSMKQVASMAKHARSKEASDRLLKIVEEIHGLMKKGHKHEHIKARVVECCKQHGVDHTDRNQAEIIRQIHNVINHYTPPKNVKVTAVAEAEYQGHSVQLGKPTRGDVKKYKVFVKDPKTGNVKKVNFGDKHMEIKRDSPGHRKNFRARHNCASKKDRTTAGYWSSRMWTKKPVSKILKGK